MLLVQTKLSSFPCLPVHVGFLVVPCWCCSGNYGAVMLADTSKIRGQASHTGCLHAVKGSFKNC